MRRVTVVAGTTITTITSATAFENGSGTIAVSCRPLSC